MCKITDELNDFIKMGEHSETEFAKYIVFLAKRIDAQQEKSHQEIKNISVKVETLQETLSPITSLVKHSKLFFSLLAIGAILIALLGNKVLELMFKLM